MLSLLFLTLKLGGAVEPSAEIRLAVARIARTICSGDIRVVVDKAVLHDNVRDTGLAGA